jgi:hypothetical protein
VGDTILRWDGQKWDSVSASLVGSVGPIVLGGVAVWVNAPNDVWLGEAFKAAFHWTGAAWTTVPLNDNRVARTFWGSGPSDVWTSDCLGAYVGHWDGTGWNHLNSTENGVAIWGSGTTDVWMVERSFPFTSFSCDSGSTFITHWNGIGGFGGKETQFTFPHNLRAIWGSGTNDIWAVGEVGAIVHYDGTAWSPITTPPTTIGLRGIWGTAANDVWAVGDSGVIEHFDGSRWSQDVRSTSRTLRAVWGDPSGELWVVGDAGTLLHLAR